MIEENSLSDIEEAKLSDEHDKDWYEQNEKFEKRRLELREEQLKYGAVEMNGEID